MLTSSIIVLCIVFASGMTAPELPETWTKDFAITLSYSGSMDGSSTHITFTYDTCTYARQTGMTKHEQGTFVLTEADRKEILKKLHELKVDKIRSETNMIPVKDGWSTSLCFGTHCVEAGTSAKISDQDKEIFSQAYDYLENFAAGKAKLKKRKR